MAVLKEAKENRNSDDLVFGKKYDRVYSAFKRVVRLMGVDGKGADSINLHTLRHTHASRLDENGYSEFVAVALGHSDRQTAKRYVHPGEKRLREAQESLVAYSVT